MREARNVMVMIVNESCLSISDTPKRKASEHKNKNKNKKEMERMAGRAQPREI